MHDLYATVGVNHRPWLGKFSLQLGPFFALWGFNIRCTTAIVYVKLTPRKFHKLSLSTAHKFNWRIVACSMMLSPGGGGQTQRLNGWCYPRPWEQQEQEETPTNQALRGREQQKEWMRYHAVPCRPSPTASLQHSSRESSVYVGALCIIVHLIMKTSGEKAGKQLPNHARKNEPSLSPSFRETNVREFFSSLFGNVKVREWESGKFARLKQ